jgi:3-methyladenine DNA glycosylase/8-oxoguanine DNA glycosylase
MTQPSTVPNTGLAERYSAARSALSKADPVMAQLIEEHPDFDPRAFLAQLPKMDAFGTLLFQIIGQQLSVVSTRAILNRLEALFGGRLPTPRELIDIGAEQVTPPDCRSAKSRRCGRSHKRSSTAISRTTRWR